MDQVLFLTEDPSHGSDDTAEKIDPVFLHRTSIDYADSDSTDLLARWQKLGAWWAGRAAFGLDPYMRSTASKIATHCTALSDDGVEYVGVNFASQEYLSMASHPAVCAAAKATIDQFGVHSAGSATLMGKTLTSRALETRFAEFLGYENCTIFPTGWGAGYGVIRALVRQDDYVLIDILGHACLQEGARNATQNVFTFKHLSNSAVQRRLAAIRSEHQNVGILVVTESVFSMDSDVPDLRELQSICCAYGATLMVDVAHDLGAIGPTGRGYMELQNMVGEIDIVMGSFSKTFASNGGFVASNARGLPRALHFLSGPLTFTNAMSPISAAIIAKVLEIVQSGEGAARRDRLMRNIIHMRTALTDAGFKVMGQPSAIIPVQLGDSAVSRIMTRFTLEAGGIVNLVEHPAVSRNTCRWRLQVMADHTIEQIDHFIAIAIAARERTTRQIEAISKHQQNS